MLTDQQARVMHLMTDGLTAKEVGKKLGISHRTVEIHVERAITALGAHNRVHAVVLWDRHQRPKVEMEQLPPRLEFERLFASCGGCNGLGFVRREQ